MNVCVFTSVKYLNSEIFYKKNAQKVFICFVQYFSVTFWLRPSLEASFLELKYSRVQILVVQK